MNIIINGESKIVKKGITIAELLEKEGCNKWAMVWVNDEHILMKDYASYELNEGDKVKINKVLVGG